MKKTLLVLFSQIYSGSIMRLAFIVYRSMLLRIVLSRIFRDDTIGVSLSNVKIVDWQKIGIRIMPINKSLISIALSCHQQET